MTALVLLGLPVSVILTLYVVAIVQAVAEVWRRK